MNPRIQKILDNCMPIPWSGCLVWMGSLNHGGYANGSQDGKTVLIHRFVYKQIFGDIGDLVIDHLCRVRCCVNPDHLEAVTNKENIHRGNCQAAKNLRKDHCNKGHKYDHIVKSSGVRGCSICRKEWNRLRYAKPTQQIN